MAACALLGDSGDHVSGNGSNNNSQSPSLNSNSQGSSVEQNAARSKMVRKRMASEIEVNNSLRSNNNNNGGDNYMRISRNRSVVLNPNPTHDGSNKLVSNYSTTILNLPLPQI
ncbi:hypothetical protein M0R45_028705 [Rubus argutus]|uniref:Uncharacterized protein n=1 Tax=Rubus argutus TaxID=59490 RepID=A0AAW1WA49_RUBAR